MLTAYNSYALLFGQDFKIVHMPVHLFKYDFSHIKINKEKILIRTLIVNMKTLKAAKLSQKNSLRLPYITKYTIYFTLINGYANNFK